MSAVGTFLGHLDIMAHNTNACDDMAQASRVSASTYFWIRRRTASPWRDHPQFDHRESRTVQGNVGSEVHTISTKILGINEFTRQVYYIIVANRRDI